MSFVRLSLVLIMNNEFKANNQYISCFKKDDILLLFVFNTYTLWKKIDNLTVSVSDGVIVTELGSEASVSEFAVHKIPLAWYN